MTTHIRPGRLLFLLFLVNFLNFFDRALPAVVLDPLSKEFGLSDTEMGALGTAFVLIYALAGVPLGRLSDSKRRLSVLAAGVAVWSAMTAAIALSRNFTMLLLLRLGVGVGEASCAPAANSLIADLYPASRRAKAIGFFMLGLPLGSLSAFALGGWMAQTWGWRMPFIVAAIPGLLLAIALYFAKEPLRGAQDNPGMSTTAPVRNPLRTLLSIPTLWALIISGAAINFAAYALNTFLPVFLIRYHGASLTSAGTTSGIVLGLTGLVGLTLGGWLADHAHQWRESGRLALGAASLAIAAPLAWLGLTQPAGAVTLVTVLLSASWLLVFLYYVTVYPAIHDVVRPELRATGMALYFLMMYVLGGGLGTLVTGALSDHFAQAAMLSAQSTVMTDAFRSIALRDALAIVIPASLAVTALAIAWGCRTFASDRRRCLQAGAQ